MESLPDVNVPIVSEDFSSDLRLVDREEKKQLGGVYVKFSNFDEMYISYLLLVVHNTQGPEILIFENKRLLVLCVLKKSFSHLT